MCSSKKDGFKLLITRLLIISILFSSCTTSRKILDGQLEKTNLSNSFHGLVVMDARSGKTIYNRNGDRYFTPASNTKIVTFYTGVKLLSRNIPTLSYAVSNDTLFIQGTDD